MKIFRIKNLIYFIYIIPTFLFSQNIGDTTNGILWEYLEWEVDNTTFDGNPYDLLATVTFTHEQSGETRTTEMFYDENDIWKFRFAGTRTGTWNFTTASNDPELNELTGSVFIEKNSNQNRMGFLTHLKNKFAIQTNPDSLKGMLFNVYMNKTKDEYSFRNGNHDDFINYAKEAKSNGCTAIFSNVVANSWFNFPTLKTSEGIKTDPDPATFRKLEEMISAAREEGVLVHIWAWGDEDNEESQVHIGEGVNGREDKRLQRYIASRLGALPGWSMGYGFDLHEWTDSNEVREWADFMQEKLGWRHLLSARGQILTASNSINSYDGAGRNVPLHHSRYGPENYEEVSQDMLTDLTHPHFYEERHTYNRVSRNGLESWHLDMEKTRRLMWWESMSGGMGGWFGFFEESASIFGGHPYSNPEQLRTHSEFWLNKNRFLLELEINNSFSNGYGLKTLDNENFIIYKENTDEIRFNLRRMERLQPAIAIDTKGDYEEIDLGIKTATNYSWEAPYKSDWAIAIGFSDIDYGEAVQDTLTGVMWKFLEWEVDNTTYDENPYDLLATVTFTHELSGETRTTEMFYDENAIWKFRFTGTKVGIWNFISTSDDTELDELIGVVNIKENASNNATGFLTNVGNKFASQVSEDSVSGFIFNVYMNKTKDEYSFRNGNHNDFINYAREAKDNGCSVIFSNVVANSWFNFPTFQTSEGIKTDPDPATFRKLEEMISAAREEGVLVHIWTWGDQSREQTPMNVGGGINGKEDKRLQRYIAARLGALPGWSMGYGFDLHEWTNTNQVREWAEFMQEKLGWRHLLSARGQILTTSNSINSYDGAGRNVPLHHSRYGPENYEEVSQDMLTDLTHPHFYEERHTYNRKSRDGQESWNLDMDRTRKLMWWETMSGGMGGWFGFYEESSIPFGGYPYPNTEQLKTHKEFWTNQNRFMLDLEINNSFSNGNGLKTPNNENFIIYKEDTDEIRFNLRRMERLQPAIAIDTKGDYKEIDLGIKTATNYSWKAPYKSDWAIAIGFSDMDYGEAVQDTLTELMWEFIEWEVGNTTFDGNPYDLLATVTFTHQQSGETRTTEMFYDENNIWKFRFTGTRTGTWNYLTTSNDSDLDDLTGSVFIEDNSNPDRTGFLTHYNNKFAIQVNKDSIKGFLFNVYMDKTIEEYSFRTGRHNDFVNYAREAKDNGCSVIFSHVVANSWFNFPTLKTSEGIKTDPDPATFRKLEEMISAARDEGVLVHIWAWGDEHNKLSQVHIGEGINGKEDKRLQRYIAARLGALPGWSMGYGFDLHEWVTKNGHQPINEWVDYMQNHLGWNHLLSARGLSIDKPNMMNSYDGFGRKEANLFTTPYGPQNYNEVLEDITEDKTKPHFYEERHSYNRQDDPSTGTNGEWNLDMDGTRRLMWWEAMAGGIGGWFGFYEEGSFPFGGHPYPKSEQLKTHREFWTEGNRFVLTLEVDSTFTNGNGLKTPDNKNYIVYKENTDNLLFSTFNFDQKLLTVAVDTKQEYKEIFLGELSAGNHNWKLPHISDWVIAVGNFNQPKTVHPIDTTAQSNVDVSNFSFSQLNNNIILEWVTQNENNLVRFEIQKTIEGDSLVWQTIGLLVGKGTNEIGGNYSFTDAPNHGNKFLMYRLKMVFADNTFTYSEIISVENIPTNFSLSQNYPNPFNSSTTIEFSLPKDEDVNLSIYNILGQKITTLVDKDLVAGYHSYKLDASNLSSGIYYYRFTSPNRSVIKKMLYLK